MWYVWPARAQTSLPLRYKEAAQVLLNLFMSKCHIVGNLMSRLKLHYSTLLYTTLLYTTLHYSTLHNSLLIMIVSVYHVRAYIKPLTGPAQPGPLHRGQRRWNFWRSHKLGPPSTDHPWRGRRWVLVNFRIIWWRIRQSRPTWRLGCLGKLRLSSWLHSWWWGRWIPSPSCTT